MVASIALAVLAAAAQPAWPSLDTCIPAETGAVWFGRPSPDMLDAAPGGTMDQLSGWLLALKTIGVIPAEGRVLADILGSMPILSRRPHAIALIDITSQKLEEETYRLRTLQAVLVIDSAGIEQQLDRRVRDLLMTYTNAQSGSVTTLTAGKVTYYRLVDRRLPEWAVAEWGSVGERFVVGFGIGAFTAVLDTIEGRRQSLARSSWFVRAHERCHGGTSGIEVFADFTRIRERVGEVAELRADDVLRSVGMLDVERLLWTIGFDGRALHSEIMGRRAMDRDEYLMLAGRELVAPEVAELIPPGASRYAALRFSIPDAVRSGREAYFGSMFPAKREQLSVLWTRVSKEFGFNTDHGLIDQLGDHLIFHTFPPHPLGMPVLCTIWIRIQGDSPLVCRTIDGMMTAWQQTVNPVLPQSRPALTISPRVERSPDGIWYLQLGIAGPAIAVAEGWIVISYSPEAVRENLSYLSAHGHPAATRPAAMTSGTHVAPASRR